MHKKFCIASLTGLNDFKNLFSKGILDPVKNSDLYRCIANTSETLTLKNVYISIKGSEEIEIIFSLPLNDGKKVKFRLYFNGTAQENGKILSAPVVNGEKIENPKYLRKSIKRLKYLQKKVKKFFCYIY